MCVTRLFVDSCVVFRCIRMYIGFFLCGLVYLVFGVDVGWCSLVCACVMG